MKSNRIRSVFAGIAFLAVVACGPDATESPGAEKLDSNNDLRQLAAEAWVYGFPMVMNYKTLYNYAIDEQNPEYKGPLNSLVCEARLFTPDDTAIVTPNADTPYCFGWLDLRAEPVVLSVPAVELDRYYSFQLIDLFTHNFAYVGTLSTGNDAGTFLITGPDWSGATPEGIDAVIRSETDFILSITRTQLFGPDDLERVQAIQEAYELQLLSSFMGTEPGAVEALPVFPEWTEGAQFDGRSLEYIDLMLRLAGAVPTGEESLWQRMATIGLGPGADGNTLAWTEAERAALADGVSDGFRSLEAFIQKAADDPLGSAKIFGTRDFLEQSARDNYGLDNIHLLRSAGAHLGLYGNSAVEAIYPTYLLNPGGGGYDASTYDYTLRFDELPPVKAFWSLTMYDGRSQLFVRNDLGRYLVSSVMLDNLDLAEDGSLQIHVSHDSPGANAESNWLPAPDGPFYMVLRLYGPEQDALTGEWMPPALVPVDK